MGTLLLRNIHTLATMDGEEISGASILVRDGWIEDLGPVDDLPENAMMSSISQITSCSRASSTPTITSIRH
jgi:hypothetical protein